MLEYNLSYDYAAIIILICILVIHGSNKNTPLLQNKVFTLMAVFALLSGLSDILDVIGNAYPSYFSMGYHHLTSYVFFLSLNTAPFTYALYTLSLRENKISSLSRRTLFLLFVPIILLYVVVLSNPITHGIFYYDQNKGYHRGSGQAMLYAISLYYLIFGAVVTTFNRNKMTIKHKTAVYLFIIIGFGSSLLQLALKTELVGVFGTSICILLILLAIQKPEESLDPKLGVFNYSTFAQIFQLHISGKGKGTLFLLYIEDIPLLNQAIGVAMVDGYLSQIGKYVEKLSYKNSFYLGGNVFAIIGSIPTSGFASRFASSIEKRFEEPWSYQDSNIYMTCRLLELSIPDDVQTIEEVQAYKDYLKNLTKKSTSNWYLKAEHTSLSMTKRKMQVEAAIKRAIQEDYFEVYYQPIYSVSRKQIVCAEALLRLKDPEMGFIPPDEFILVAENNGTILKIGEMVFEKVCKFINNNDLNALGIQYIEINLSVVQCLQENLAKQFIDIMEKYHIDSSLINLEITETAAASSPKMLKKNMKELFSHGISFSLDDFGTGYSNMSAIMELPLDLIKFDKSMIDAIDSSPKSKIVFLGSIAMIQQMDMKIVAEGIERKEQVEAMERMGIEYLQGYYFSKPVPGQDFIAYVSEFNSSPPSLVDKTL